MLIDGGYHILGNESIARIYRQQHPEANVITVDQYNAILRQTDFTPGMYGDAEREYEEAKAEAEAEEAEAGLPQQNNRPIR